MTLSILGGDPTSMLTPTNKMQRQSYVIKINGQEIAAQNSAVKKPSICGDLNVTDGENLAGKFTKCTTTVDWSICGDSLPHAKLVWMKIWTFLITGELWEVYIMFVRIVAIVGEDLLVFLCKVVAV